MELSHFFEDWSQQGGGLISGVTSDSRCVQPGDLFLAYPGFFSDGRHYIQEALDRGCSGVFYESDQFSWPQHVRCPHVPVSGLRSLSGWIARFVYQDPSSRLLVSAVTGTNGKTTTVFWLSFLYQALGSSGAFIGTLGWGVPDCFEPSSLTTPDASSLHRSLSCLEKKGTRYVALEASSIGLEQDRLQGVHLDAAIFTNLQTDHLDYHGTRVAYGHTKLLLFKKNLNCILMNQDDPFSSSVRAVAKNDTQIRSFAVSHSSQDNKEKKNVDFWAHDLAFSSHAVQFHLRFQGCDYPVSLPVPSVFNVYNFLGVAGLLVHQGFLLPDILAVARHLPCVPGRLQWVGEEEGCSVWVDYAHTPEALQHVLQFFRHTQPERTVVCVFGCGGERDTEKRPMMGGIASKWADHVILTSDNPRRENPQRIIDDILCGCSPSSCVSIVPDRYTAIVQTVCSVLPGSLVVVAGKGHESYQIVGQDRYPFSDFEVSYQALQERKRRLKR